MILLAVAHVAGSLGRLTGLAVERIRSVSSLNMLLWGCLFYLGLVVHARPREHPLGDGKFTYTMSLGKAIGKQVVGKVDGRVTTQFRGIPYAKAPENELRFKKPVEYGNWSGVKDLTLYKPMCLQDASRPAVPFHPKVKENQEINNDMDEDCLYLNLYLPIQKFKDIRELSEYNHSVVVFFHNGGFQSGNPNHFPSSILSQHGSVVVVTVQYRLNVFGFFRADEDELSGNLGLYDQRMALRWVQKHIQEFGGDPNKVTIYGVEAGGASVGFHVLSPASRTLFKRAISVSGSAFSPILGSAEKMTELSRMVGHNLGCNGNETRTAQMMKCLRGFPHDKITKAAQEVEKSSDQKFMPIIDEKFIPGNPEELIRNKEFNEVDYIVGFMSHEGYSFQRNEILHNLNSGTTRKQFDSTVKDYFQNREPFAINYEQVVELLKVEYDFCNNPLNRSEGLVDLFGEYYVIAPAIKFAELYSKFSKKASVYVFEFAHRPKYTAPGVPSFVKTAHGTDWDFLFGNVKYVLPDSDVSSSERDLSSYTMKLLTNFAVTGFRGGTSLSFEWKPYSEGNQNYLHIESELSKKSLQKDFRPRRMMFWNRYIPLVVQKRPCLFATEYCRSYATKSLNFQWIAYGCGGACLVLFLLVVILAVKVVLPDCCVKTREYPPVTNMTVAPGPPITKVPVEDEKEELGQKVPEKDEISIDF